MGNNKVGGHPSKHHQSLHFLLVLLRHMTSLQMQLPLMFIILVFLDLVPMPFFCHTTKVQERLENAKYRWLQNDLIGN
jgi:hypothetical protein